MLYVAVITALVLDDFSLTKGPVMFFRSETIVVKFLPFYIFKKILKVTQFEKVRFIEENELILTLIFFNFFIL